jgi:ATP synthase in type III secretion protein N
MTRENNSTPSLLAPYFDRLKEPEAHRLRGAVREMTGLTVAATLPDGRIGDIVLIAMADREPLAAEIVGFRNDTSLLMPLGDIDGVGIDAEVENTHAGFQIRCGEGLLGRVLDGLGNPIDDLGPLPDAKTVAWPVQRPAPRPLERALIQEPLETGVRVVDGLLTIGRGQRLGLFAGAGVGKSSLLAQIARHNGADVTVICLVGERGREIREFRESLSSEVLARSVFVCATSDEPSLVRLKSAQVATAIAEWFRGRGDHVLLLMDSLTRFARAQREVGLAAGEPPVRRGYPPSVFRQLPRLVERSGTAARGVITAIYTVLVEGDDLAEPIADEARALLDGHIVLSRTLAEQGHWPAVDVLRSTSRVMPRVVSADHAEAATALRRHLSVYEQHRDLIRIGAYQYGSDAEVDRGIDDHKDWEVFLQQAVDEGACLAETLELLMDLELV